VGPRNQTEGLPTIIVEALAHRRPVIASRLTGIPEIVHDQQTGLLVDPEDVEGIVVALRDVRDNPEAAYERARRGRELVEREFDQGQNLAALANLIGQASASTTLRVVA
jgi:glycosyltransferase involved in cell wall biosynthesis